MMNNPATADDVWADPTKFWLKLCGLQEYEFTHRWLMSSQEYEGINVLQYAWNLWLADLREIFQVIMGIGDIEYDSPCPVRLWNGRLLTPDEVLVVVGLKEPFGIMQSKPQKGHLRREYRPYSANIELRYDPVPDDPCEEWEA